MRTSVIIATLLVLGLAAAAPASAGPAVCQDAGFGMEPVPVAASVTYGGVGCLDASVERCQYTSNPERPGLVWTCEKVL